MLNQVTAEQAQADAAFLESILAANGDCIKVLDLDGNLIFMSKGGQAVMEVSDFNAIRGCPWPSFWDGEGRAWAMAAIELAKAGKKGHFRAQANTMAGKLRSWDVQVTPIYDAQGKVSRLLSVSRDITATEQAMQALRDRETTRRRRDDLQRQALFELGDRLSNTEDISEISRVASEIIGRTLAVNRVGYVTVAPDGQTIFVNRDWTAPGTGSVAGTHRAEDYGKSFTALIAGDIVSIDDIEQDPRSAAKADAYRALSIRALLNVPLLEQGRFVAYFFVNSAVPRKWDLEEIDFVSHVGERTRAAIERRRAEQALRDIADSLAQQVAQQTRERNRLWHLSEDPFLIVDAQGRWLRVNPAWTRLLGWTEDELLGQTSAWLMHPEDSHRATPDMGITVSGGVSGGVSIGGRVENRLRTKSGDYRWFSWTSVPADGLFYCVARDVTAERTLADERALLEEALRQSQKMEAVGQLTGGLAHDFNNLLTGITGSLELLGTRVAQGRLSEVERYIAAAQGAAKRAAALTHRLLAFSRRQTLDPKPVDVNRLIADMEELLRRTVGPAIEIEVVGTAGAWPILVDPNQLENALLNLCINARDAMPEGGRITIETANKWLDAWTGRERDLPPGQYLALCVTDTGTGMPLDVIERAFDPFFTTKPLGMGTGLGLSMIYGFVRQSGGQVRIYSEIDKGTTMTLFLPRHYGDADAPADEDSAIGFAPTEQGLTVLVVDDEPTIRMLITEVLSELGYVAIEAADGPAGLKIVESNVRIDLMVSDVGLPGGMNGRQLADAARVLRPELEVLFITGYAENAAVGNGLLAPGMHVLTKPFTMETLTRRIQDLVAQ